MNLWSLPLIVGLSLALPLVPSEARAPTQISEAEAFSAVGGSGFSYRWTQVASRADHSCQLYKWCTFADILGPSCNAEVLIALQFYDKNGDLVADGGDVIAGLTEQRHLAVEIGTNRDITFDSLNIVDMTCGAGLLTGEAQL